MGLYSNILYWNYSINTGEYVGWYRNSFSEIEIEVPTHMFKVLEVNLKEERAKLEVVQSEYLTVGEILENFPIQGLVRKKYPI